MVAGEEKVNSDATPSSSLADSFDFWAVAEGRAAPPPSARLVNWRFVALNDGTLSCAFEASEAFLNPAGFVQGGILATMLDEVMSPVVGALLRERVFTQTLEMKVSYLNPARQGTILGEGRILKRGNKIAFLEGRLFDPDRNLIAVGSATARIVLADR